MIKSIESKLAKLAGAARVGGGATENAILTTSSELGLTLPGEFLVFARTFGWLEIENVYFFGVPNDPLKSEGSALRMTAYARDSWSLPANLIVVYSSEDEVLWCLTGANNESEIARNEVLAYSTRNQRVVGRVGESFLQVVDSYLDDH